MKPALASGVFVVALVFAGLMTTHERWFHVIASAVFVGLLAILAVRPASQIRRAWWIGGAVALGLGGFGAYLAWTSAQSACLANAPDGRQVVIGTEFTARGAAYHSRFPTDDNDHILEALAGLGPEEAWTETSIARCRMRLRLWSVLPAPLLGGALMCVVALFGAAGIPRKSTGTARRVFISYNHGDAAAAVKVRDALRKAGVDVIFDADSMKPGARIEDFIEQSVRDADVVVSIVSTRSLLSAWVAMETLNSFEKEKWLRTKTFIACTLTSDFFDRSFVLDSTRRIDARLGEIESLFPKYAAEKIDTVDLNDEKSRLYNLRSHLSAIVARLKASLCVDIEGANFDSGLTRLIEAVKGPSDGVST